jgi:ribosome-binding protein aMBF1 (putative translation factor)
MVADASQLALALKIDVHVSRVRNWEKGRMQPTEPELQTLADALGLSVQELIGKAEPQNGAGTV